MLHLRLTALGLAGLLAMTASAEDPATPEYQEGQHYTVLTGTPPAQAPEGKTELMEFFWYGCPHCYKMEPLLNEWLEERANAVHLRLLPTVFSARWAIGARVYYALEEIGRLDLHPVVFSLVHEQGRPLKTGDGIGRMLEPFEVDPATFAKAFRSQAVTDRVEATREFPEVYGIDGVPALVVDGRYRITTQNANSYQMLLDIADFLIREKP